MNKGSIFVRALLWFSDGRENELRQYFCASMAAFGGGFLMAVRNEQGAILMLKF